MGRFESSFTRFFHTDFGTVSHQRCPSKVIIKVFNTALSTYGISIMQQKNEFVT